MSAFTSLWDASASYERVALEDLTVELQVGVNQWERAPGKAQRVLVTVEMFRHRGPFTGSSVADCINYDRVYRHITARNQGDLDRLDGRPPLLRHRVAGSP